MISIDLLLILSFLLIVDGFVLVIVDRALFVGAVTTLLMNIPLFVYSLHSHFAGYQYVEQIDTLLTIFYGIVVFVLILQFGLTRIICKSSIISSKIQYVLILGERLHHDKLSINLTYRLEHAIKLFHDNSNIKFIVSGGVTKGNSLSEAFCMKTYLNCKGIDNNLIIIENQALNTYQNFQNIIGVIGTSETVCITSSYHIIRAFFVSKILGIKCTFLGSKSFSLTTVNYYIQEAVGITSYLCRFMKHTV